MILLDDEAGRDVGIVKSYYALLAIRSKIYPGISTRDKTRATFTVSPENQSLKCDYEKSNTNINAKSKNIPWHRITCRTTVFIFDDFFSALLDSRDYRLIIQFNSVPR